MNLTDIEPGRLYCVTDLVNLLPGRYRNRKLSRHSVRLWRRQGKLRGVMINGTWWFSGAAVLECLGLREEAEKPIQVVSPLEQERAARADSERVLANIRGGKYR